MSIPWDILAFGFAAQVLLAVSNDYELVIQYPVQTLNSKILCQHIHLCKQTTCFCVSFGVIEFLPFRNERFIRFFFPIYYLLLALLSKICCNFLYIFLLSIFSFCFFICPVFSTHIFPTILIYKFDRFCRNWIMDNELKEEIDTCFL